MNFLLVINVALISLLPQMFYGLAQGLRARGARARVAFVHTADDPLIAPESRDALAQWLETDPRDPDWFVLKANEWPGFLWDAYCRDPRLVLVDCNAVADYPMAQRISFVTDAIYSQYENLARNLRAGQGFTIVDMEDAALAGRLGLDRPFAFVPHGGPCALSGPPLQDRDIEIFMPVKLNVSHDRAAFLANFTESDRRIADLAIDRVADGRSIADATQDACHARGLDAAPAQLAHLCRIVASWVEQDARRRLIAAVKGRRIHIAGWIAPDFFERAPDHVEALGLRSGSQIGALMRRSRLVINCVRVFNKGSHERLWLAMSNGALCLTDVSSFVAADFAHGREIWTIPAHLGELDSILAAALDDLEASQNMVARAQEIYLRHHSWEDRAQRLIDFAAGLGWIDRD